MVAMRKIFFLLISVFILALALVACDRDFSDKEGDELAMLEAWVQVNGIPTESLKPSGLYFVNQQEGTGLSPSEGDFVIYSYKEKSLDGIVLSTNDSATAVLYGEYNVNVHYSQLFTKYDKSNSTVEGYQREMVKGVHEGLGYMKEGGKAMLIMPSKLAYGKRSVSYTSSVIRPYQSLVYEVELHKVVKNPREYELQLLHDYMNLHYPGLAPVNDSIYYIQLSPPTNDTVTLAKDSVAYVYYKGMLLDGYMFDSNIDSVATRLGRSFSSTDSLKVTVATGVIKGFSQALVLMKKGEWGRVIMPSYCGYDSVGSTTIPPYSPLIFDLYFSSKSVVTKPKSK